MDAMTTPTLTTAVRLNNTGGLEVATTHLTREGRRVELVGVMHIADKSFWDQIVRLVDNRISEGREVQSELILGGPKLSYLKPVLDKVAERLAAKGLALQPKMLNYKAGHIKVHDFTYQQVVNHVGTVQATALTFGSLLAHVVLALSTNNFRNELFGEEFVKNATGAVETSLSGMHEERETVALDAVEATTSGGCDVTTLWGAGHVPRMTRTLVGRGWVHESTQWRQALARTETP